MKGIVAVMVIITLSSSSAQIFNPSSLAALREILSPANTDKTMQLIKMGALRSNGNARPDAGRVICKESPVPIRYGYEMPRAVVASEIPARIPDDYRVGNPDIFQKITVREEVPNFVNSLKMPKEIFQAFAPQECTKPLPAFNPFLPIASPVSAMSLGNLPPPTQSKGHFLRKIPIPPPSL